MNTVLSDISALNYWRRHPELLGTDYAPRQTMPSRKGHVQIDLPSAALIDELASLNLVDINDAHLLVSSSESRRNRQGVSYTICHGPFPAHSFFRARAQVYVPCPELLFLLMARRLPLVQLLEVGFELCGTYRMIDGVPCYDNPPLTSVAAVRDYANRANDMHGRKAAANTAQWLIDGSGSPAETALAIVLGLPYRHGGYGLGGFQLNRTITLNESAARILGRSTIRPDFYWPEARHPAEYDGSMYHSSREQADYDERRRNAYAAMGMSVTVFRPRHLVSHSLMDEMATGIRHNIGARLNRVPADYDSRKDALAEEAFRYWIGLRDSYGTGEEFRARVSSWAEPPNL